MFKLIFPHVSNPCIGMYSRLWTACYMVSSRGCRCPAYDRCLIGPFASFYRRCLRWLCHSRAGGLACWWQTISRATKRTATGVQICMCDILILAPRFLVRVGATTDGQSYKSREFYQPIGRVFRSRDTRGNWAGISSPPTGNPVGSELQGRHERTPNQSG